MEAQIDGLASHILDRHVHRQRTSPDARLLVAIAGIPGSGKTTLARRVVEKVNDELKAKREKEEAVVIGLDGWHYPRSVLDTFPDPTEAHARRGAPHTFDSPSFAYFASLLALPLPSAPRSSPQPHYPSLPLLAAPSFSHSKKDPVPLSLAVLPHHRIVIFEGLYVLVDQGAWKAASERVDVRVLVEVDVQTARKRLAERHVESGICSTLEQGEKRGEADENDLPNGEWLLSHMLEPTFRVSSVLDPAFSGDAP